MSVLKRRGCLAAALAMLLGSMSSVACHTRVKNAVSLALTDYVFSLLDPANIADLLGDSEDTEE